MASSSLLALIDDIASLLDDVAAQTKIVVKKTSGVLGDDLALNAQQVSGTSVDREIPVVLAVAKGSAINKAILVPLALGISFYVPILINPLLSLGGLYLCFEGFEKIWEKLFYRNSAPTTSTENINLKSHHEINESSEHIKIKGAIRTDFVLSAEIVVIALGSLAAADFATQVTVLVAISIIMTVGVYGLVAGIVKLDDLGLHLARTARTSTLSSFKISSGNLILKAAPVLMKTLGIVGTAAMFLVGGGIISHAVPYLHLIQKNLSPPVGLIFDGFVGLMCGALVLMLVTICRKILSSSIKAPRTQHSNTTRETIKSSK